MSDYRKLTKQQESVIVGKVTDLYRKGYDVYEIAAELNQPIARVQTWYDMVIKYEKERLKDVSDT